MSKWKWFTEEMSSDQARKVILSLSKEEYEKNKEEIMKEYGEVLSIIIPRETERALQGWLD